MSVDKNLHFIKKKKNQTFILSWVSIPENNRNVENAHIP